jgi:hypothetical protein
MRLRKKKHFICLVRHFFLSRATSTLVCKHTSSSYMRESSFAAYPSRSVNFPFWIDICIRVSKLEFAGHLHDSHPEINSVLYAMLSSEFLERTDARLGIFARTHTVIQEEREKILDQVKGEISVLLHHRSSRLEEGRVSKTFAVDSPKNCGVR